MRIVLVSTSDLQGGAARATLRLLRGLRELGEECSLLVKQKQSQHPDVHPLTLEERPLTRRGEYETGRIRQYCIERQRTELSNTWFSLPVPGYDLSRHERVQSSDILHLHWVSELLSPAAIAKLQLLGKPLVWTLHDQRAFTGGCHYSAGCRGFESDCQSCPQLNPTDLTLTETNLQESRQCLGPNLAIVCPSRWMADCARRSALLRNTRIEVIPNGIDTRVFKPQRAAARRELGLDPKSIYLLAGADYGGERRKGFHLLRDAVRQSMTEPAFREWVTAGRVRFLFFGQTPPMEDLGFPVQSLGRLDAEAELAKVYAASDAFLLPSTEDNLPNTMLESMCSGTPVIGFAIGGLPELIESGQNGLLVANLDAGQLGRAIRDFAESADLRQKLTAGCTEQLRAKLSFEEQARRHRSLYTDLLRTHTAPGSLEPPTAVLPLMPFGCAFGAYYPVLLRRARSARFKRRWPFVYRLVTLFRSN